MAVAVKFDDVYKEYPYYQHITAGFKTFLFQLRKNVALLKKKRFVALRDVSFEVARGETFGFIGRNGAGKSTILGLIAGVIRQDRGSIATNGRISSLLELGAGFHPDLSGLENIILNGILMGNTKKAMLGKMEEIIDFSELGEFVYQPLRTYSSGMQIRLGFSIAVNTNPEILLVDEALAVGDIGFQEKCAKKMLQFKSEGATIIFVSHEMEPISKLCDRVAWLDGGKIMKIGAPREVIPEYLLHVGEKRLVREIDADIQEGLPGAETAGEGISEEKTVEEAVAEDVAGRGGLACEGSDDAECESGPSWWDVPLVMQHSEEIITGNRNMRFWDYLRTERLVGQAKTGVSICHNLKGIVRNFVDAGLCGSLIALEDEAESAVIEKSAFDFRGKSYDFFLCVDVLHRVRRLDRFLSCVDGALAAGGVIVAIEYVGPLDRKLGGKAQEAVDIANRIFFREWKVPPGTTDHSEVGPSPGGTVISEMQKFFDIAVVRNFAGPLYDRVVNRIIRSLDPAAPEVAAGIKAVLLLDGLLASEGTVGYDYAVIVAGKKNKTESEA